MENFKFIESDNYDCTLTQAYYNLGEKENANIA